MLDRLMDWTWQQKKGSGEAALAQSGRFFKTHRRERKAIEGGVKCSVCALIVLGPFTVSIFRIAN